MTGLLWAALQGAVEYGVLSGGAGAGGPVGPHGPPILAWAADHLVIVLAVAAGLLLLGLVRTARHR
jgi:hypothetical protein